MSTILHRLKTLLEDAERCATLETMSAGFPDDRIEIKSVNFGNDDRGRVGDIIHPTEYVRNITRIYRETWILSPLREAIAIVEANQDLIERVERLRQTLNEAGIDEIQHINNAGQK